MTKTFKTPRDERYSAKGAAQGVVLGATEFDDGSNGLNSNPPLAPKGSSVLLNGATGAISTKRNKMQCT